MGAAGTVTWTDPGQEIAGVLMVQQITADLADRGPKRFVRQLWTEWSERVGLGRHLAAIGNQ